MTGNAGSQHAEGKNVGTRIVRVPLAVYEELVEMQRAIKAEHKWDVSLGNIVELVLADRKAAKP